jgi:hypothetical protein
MLRSMIFAVTVNLAVVPMAFAADPWTVKSVDVTTDLAAVANPTAATYWARLDEDLEGAIASRLGDRIATKGVDISIDIAEVELSNGFTDAIGLADTRIIGDVTMRNDDDKSQNRFYQLLVDVNQAKPMISSDVSLETLPADARVYYDAMIAAFAQAIVSKLE